MCVCVCACVCMCVCTSVCSCSSKNDKRSFTQCILVHRYIRVCEPASGCADMPMSAENSRERASSKCT